MIPLNLDFFYKNTKGANDFYVILSENKIIPTGRKKWVEIFDIRDNKWEKIYQIPFRTTANTKLPWLQVRILHHILTTNMYLCKAGLSNNPLCVFCNLDRETIIHTLWECAIVQNFLHSFETLLEALIIPFSFNKESFLFGIVSQSGIGNRLDNEILIMIKHCIYKTRCLQNNLSVNALINSIKDHYSVQKYIACCKGDNFVRKLEREWKKWNNLLEL